MKLPVDGLFENTEVLNLVRKQEQLQRSSIMPATSALNPARLQVPPKHGAASRTGTDSGLLIAAGLVRFKGDCMGYNARNDEIHENLEQMRRECEAYEDSLAIVRQFNARLSAENATWFWPTVAAALASKHHWLALT